jgi:hypothetical protein
MHRERVNSLMVVVIVVCMDSLPVRAQAEESVLSLTSGHLGLGAGSTVEYHFDGTSRARIGEFTWTWDRDRLEFSAFRFFDAQRRGRIALAVPNWTYEMSTRWTFIHNPKVKMFLGLGGAYKSETDGINGSRLNFAEQLGWRFTRSEVGPGFEIVVRHMSNAGLKKPNKGQDFVTIAYVF